MKRLQTIEGFSAIVDKLISEQNKAFDVVILDYFQPIGNSIATANLQPWQILDRAIEKIEDLRVKSSAPIIVFTQLRPDQKKEYSFKERIEGRKSIYDKATFVIEIIPDFSNNQTKLKVVKNRRGRSLVEFTVGWEKGLYVQLKTRGL